MFYHPDKGSLLEQLSGVRILICTLAQSEKQFAMNLGHLMSAVGFIVNPDADGFAAVPDTSGVACVPSS